MEKDFKFIVSLMDSFVKQTSIQQKLKTIEERPIKGWEIWFQVEFALHLNKHPDVADDWSREDQFKIDKRTKAHREKMAIDFLLRKKRSSTNTFIALELKQHNSVETCITNMLKDVEKVFNIRKSEDKFRSYWNIGIHPKEAKNTIRSKILKKEEKCNVSLSEYVEVRFIPKTNFAYTIF